MKIPPMPKHPRFKKHVNVAGKPVMFLSGNGWTTIKYMQGELLENCRCVARCWWLDEAAKRLEIYATTASKSKKDTMNWNKLMQAKRAAEAWRNWRASHEHQYQGQG